MNSTEARMEALKLAFQMNLSVGVGCPGCAVELANQLTAYVMTGDTKAVEHFPAPGGDQPDEKPDFQLLSFESKKVN